MTREHELARWFADRDEATAAPLRAEIERLRAAYDSRGGEMDSMRMVLAETQKWNEDALAKIERLKDRIDEHHRMFEPMHADNERLRAVIVRAKDALLDGQSTQWVHDLLVAPLLEPKP